MQEQPLESRRCKMKLTRALSRKITRDWERCLPALRAYEVRALARRVGPLVVGVVLDRDSSGKCYYPTAHVHNLAIWPRHREPVLTLTMAERLLSAPPGSSGRRRPGRISVRWHDSAYLDAASRLVHQTAIPLIRDATLGEWLDVYRQYIAAHPYWEPHALQREMIVLSVWCHDLDTAGRIIGDAEETARATPTAMTVRKSGGLDSWLSEIRSLPARRAELVETAARQASFLGVADLPYSEIAK